MDIDLDSGLDPRDSGECSVGKSFSRRVVSKKNCTMSSSTIFGILVWLGVVDEERSNWSTSDCLGKLL